MGADASPPLWHSLIGSSASAIVSRAATCALPCFLQACQVASSPCALLHVHCGEGG